MFPIRGIDRGRRRIYNYGMNVKIVCLCILPLCSFLSCSLFDDTSNIQILDAGSGIEYHDQEITLETEPSAAAGYEGVVTRAPAAFEYDITYISRIIPPEVDGVAVQASDIVLSGTTAYIAYNTAGDEFRGAVQIVDVTKENEPVILKEVRFVNMDIYSLFLDGQELVFGGAADPDVWAFRSFVGKLSLSDPKGSEIEKTITPLSSYAVTGITRHGSYYYAGTGAMDGGVEILDLDLVRAGFIERGDIRDLEAYEDGTIALAGTTDTEEEDGEILVIKGLTLSGRYSITGFGSDYAKATIENSPGNLGFLALSSEGFRVYNLDAADLSSGDALLYSLAPPSSDPRHATNSASYDGRLIFTANGEWGFRVFRQTNSTDANADFKAELAGFHEMSGLSYNSLNYSANHIEYKGGYLFVAAGIGGVCVYRLR